MKITDVTTTMLRDPEGFVIQDATIPPPRRGARGRSALFVHLKTDDRKVEGLGIGTGLRAIQSVIEDNLKDLLVGQDPFNIEKLWSDMFWRVRGYGRKGIAFQAISAVDIGLWDLKAKALGVPLYRLLGPYQETVPVYGSGGWTNFSEKELLKEQMGYVERGFPRIKMKVAKDFGQSEAEDLKRLKAVRKAAGDDVEIYVDGNNGYYAKQAIRMSKAFEEYRVGWFEEPVLADDIEGLAAIARATTIPVATGEHEYTKYGFKDLIVRGGADIVQPDIGRVGGVTEWMKVAHLAHSFNLPVAPHAVQLVHLHCACATPNLKVVEYLGVSERSDRVWYTEFPEPKNGTWTPYKDRPGLGLELNPASVRKFKV
ncbi:MAG: mandelate racemase/muconate lactonizing enzyme family protein [SAR202 cluster bacterium]|nr:mandelate racemase/muconate lactonizing enzyme family protein [SAR202 cluster bacterium]